MNNQKITIKEIAKQLQGLLSRGERAPRLVFYKQSVEFRQLAQELTCTCPHKHMPAIQLGQKRNCRWSLPNGQSLHAHWFDDRVEFHLDQIDPKRDPVSHLLLDTGALPGLFFGVLGGLMLGKRGTELLPGAALGALISTGQHNAQITKWTLGTNPFGMLMPQQI